MDEVRGEKYLRIALIVVGLVFIFGLYPLFYLGNRAGGGNPSIMSSST